MSWIKACKEFQLQRGEGAKYLVPKKGSDEYEKVNKIYDSMDKPLKKEPVKRVKTKKIKDDGSTDAIRQDIVQQIKKKIKNVKEMIKNEDEADMRTSIRNELIEHIKLHGIESL